MDKVSEGKTTKELLRWAVSCLGKGIVAVAGSIVAGSNLTPGSQVPESGEVNRGKKGSGEPEARKPKLSREPNLRLEAEVLLAYVLGVTRTQLYLVDDKPVKQDQADRFARAVKRRATGYPLQYLTGKQEFMSLEFAVQEGVLIPRSDTEVLVEKAIELLKEREKEVKNEDKDEVKKEDKDDEKKPTVVLKPVQAAGGANSRLLLAADICTGSGAVGLCIAHYVPDVWVLLTDISQEALEVAARNLDSLGLEEKVVILQGDLLEPVARWLQKIGEETRISGKTEDKTGLSGKTEPKAVIRLLDMIVANPPYISASGWEQVEPGVQQFEPRLALDGGEDGLDFYRQLVPGAASLLNIGGYLLVEIGYDQGKAVMEIFRQTGDYEELQVLQDYGRRNRVVLGRKKHK